jgi:uncharacterized protein YcaQ
MEQMTLTKAQARRFLLAHQGLWPPRGLEGKAGVLDYIRRVGCIQFDPLNIVGRNPELVLQSRVADFSPSMLRELLYEDRKLLDGWDKCGSIYCLEDRPFFHRLRERMRRQHGDSSRPATAILPQVRQAIEERGPLSSIDLDFDEAVDWSWAPTRLARAALESMYAWGELVIHHRVNTRKVYDFSRRHIPAAQLQAPDPNPTDEQHHDWHVRRRIGGIGLVWNRAGDAWLGMSKIKSKERAAALARLLESGQVIEVRVEGVNTPLYLRTENRPTLGRALDSDDLPPRATILAPLDNLLWDRRLVKVLFGFSYIWEVYKPAAKRQYGYYVLPVLYGDRFVARFEPVRDKESGALVIKNWWWEDGVSQSPDMQSALRHCFQRFQGYLGACSLQVDSRVQQQADLHWLPSPGV